MKKGPSSSARHTRKSSRSDSAINQHGMTLRSVKDDNVIDLCEIIRQRDKCITSLEAQNKRLQAVVAAKDSELEAKDSELEKALSLVALLREPENTDRATANTSFDVREEQNPQDSGEQGNGDVVTILPVAPDSALLFDMPTTETSRCDMYGPEVEDSLGMVRNGTTSPVAADNSHQVVAMELEIMSRTAAGDSTLEDPADNSFEIYEDPDTENLVEEQGSPVGPSGAGRMPLGERECEGTITWNPNMDQDVVMADQSFEASEDNPEDSSVGEQPAKTGILPSSPTTKPTILGQNYVGATLGSTAGTRTVFGSGLLNISPFAALSAAGYNPTTSTASPEPTRSEINGENDNTLQPRQESTSVTVLTGEENEYCTRGTLYAMENGQRREQSIDVCNLDVPVTGKEGEGNRFGWKPTMAALSAAGYNPTTSTASLEPMRSGINGGNENTLQPQQESTSVTVFTGEENENCTRGTLYAMENGQRREQGIDVCNLDVPVTDEEGLRNRSGRQPTLAALSAAGYNPTTSTASLEPRRSEIDGENDNTMQPQQESPRISRKRNIADMFPFASGKRFNIVEHP